jgi:hypothetical protein
LTEAFQQTWDNTSNTYVNDSKSICTYNANHVLTARIDSVWDGINKYLFSYKELYTYDAKNNLTEILKQTCDYDTGAFIIDHRTTYSYDVNNNKISELHQLRGGTNYMKHNYSYNGKMLMVDSVQSWDLNNDVFQNYSVETYTYDKRKNIATVSLVFWNEESDSFINQKPGDYDYAHVGTMYSYTYNEKNNLKTSLRQKWDKINNSETAYVFSRLTKYYYRLNPKKSKK